MINVGILGFGKMGMLHMMSCSHLEGVKVVAVADNSKKSLKKARSFGVENLYENSEELLNKAPNLDAVIITVPNYLHSKYILLALEHGLNIFVEKPMATTVDASMEIAKKVRNSGTKFMIGHNLRFLKAIQKIKAMVDLGVIGELEAVTMELVINGPFAPHLVPTPVPEWWFDPERSGGGALLDLGYHLLDLFRWFAGDTIILFSTFTHKMRLPVEDGAIVILQSKDSSSKGIINVGWYQIAIFPKYNFRTIFHGTAGYISSDDLVPRNIYLHAFREGTTNLIGSIFGSKIHPLSYTYYYESYYKELEHYFECIKNDHEPTVSAIDGLKVLELVEQAYKFENAKSSMKVID